MPRKPQAAGAVLSPATAAPRGPVLVLLDIRSAENVGAMFRTADAAGVAEIWLVGITPAPLDRFGRPRKDVAKSALGAELSVPWKQCKTVAPLVARLKRDGYTVIAIEQSADSVDYKTVHAGTRSAFVMGNEVDGIPPRVLARCDIVAELPMCGMKESLNVSVAAGIALYRMLDI